MGCVEGVCYRICLSHLHYQVGSVKLASQSTLHAVKYFHSSLSRKAFVESQIDVSQAHNAKKCYILAKPYTDHGEEACAIMLLSSRTAEERLNRHSEIHQAEASGPLLEDDC